MNHIKMNIRHNLEVHLPLLGRMNPLRESHRAFHLAEIGIPSVNLAIIESKEKRVRSILNVIDWLDVEVSKRYSPEKNSTFCNVYAHDVAFCLNCYIPRVWWKSDLANKVIAGSKVDVEYGRSVFEMNCNNLFYWFKEFGRYFDWIECDSAYQVRHLVNQGSIAIIIARNIRDNYSGHISVVIPDEKIDFGFDEQEILLQSQAGRVNRKHFYDIWWKSNSFAEFGFWVFNPNSENS